MQLEYMKSNKGGNVLVVNNFTFVTEKIYKGKHLWRCTEYRTAKCMSRCHTENDVFTKQPTDHNHVADAAKVKAKKLVIEMKEQASTSRDATHQIVSTASQGLERSTAGNLPSVVNLKQTVRRVRHVNQAPLPNPTNLEELTILAPYNMTITGENFLLHDSGPGPQRVLLFSMTRNMKILNRRIGMLMERLNQLLHYSNSFIQFMC